MKTFISTLAVFLFVSISCYSQQTSEIKTQATPVTYEYLVITQWLKTISISKGESEYYEIDIKKELSDNLRDFTPIHKRIKEFEQKGWELVSNEFEFLGSQYLNYFVTMRKPR